MVCSIGVVFLDRTQTWLSVVGVDNPFERVLSDLDKQHLSANRPIEAVPTFNFLHYSLKPGFNRCFILLWPQNRKTLVKEYYTVRPKSS